MHIRPLIVGMNFAPSKNAVKRLSRRGALTLRAKLILLIFCVACTLVVTLTLLGFGAIDQTSNTAQDVSGDALESQAKNHLTKVTRENAARNALTLERTMSESILLAGAASEYYSKPDIYLAAGMMHGPLSLQRQPNGSYSEGPDEKADLFIPNFVELNQQILEQLHISRAVDPLALGIVGNNYKAAAAYLVLSNDLTRYYSNNGLGDIPPDFRATEELFYANATPEYNPGKLSQWTGVYDDPAGQGTMMSAISPIYTNAGQFLGIAGVEFRLSDLSVDIESSSLAKGSYSFLIDRNGQTIAFPDQAYLDILGRPRKEGELGVDLSNTDGDAESIITIMAAGNRGVSPVNFSGSEKFIAYAPMGATGWSLATVVSVDTVLSEVNSLQAILTKDTAKLALTRLIPLAIFILIAVTSLASYLAYRFTLPLRQLTYAADSIGRREWDVTLPSHRDDEIGILSNTLGDMATQLKNLIGSLESRVAERTLELSNVLSNLENSNVKLSQEIAERKISDAARADLENRFKQAFHNAPIGMALMDMSGRVLNPNPKMEALFWPGFRKLEDSHDLPTLASVVAESDRTKFREFHDSLQADTISDEFSCIDHNGNQCQIVFFLSLVKSSSDRENYIVLLTQDVTDARQMTERLQHQANHDELTGLPNRRAFASALQVVSDDAAISSETHLLFLDLDRFKIVNDTCGHAEGDRLLIEVSQLIKQCPRASDVVARLGGDEFAVLLLGCTKEAALKTAETIRETIHQYEFHSNDEVFRIGASIGMVSVDDSNKSIAELQSLADAACYAAKEGGRNRVHVAETSDDVIAEHRGEMRWAQRISDAMDKDHFVLYGQKFQQLNSTSGPEHIEILVRMLNPVTNELILPGAFLPVAERYDMLVELDKWVVNNLLNLLSNREIQSNTYWVNLSGASLGDPEFCEYLINKISNSGLPAGVVNFEVTETVVIKNMNNAKALLSALRKLGCEIALDDFGSGLSTLTYLKTLDVDYLKIDGSFVKDIIDDGIDRLFVKSTIEIANHLGLKTIAEYVENDEIRDIVESLGADYAQGFGIHRPQDLNSFLDVEYRKSA